MFSHISQASLRSTILSAVLSLFVFGCSQPNAPESNDRWIAAAGGSKVSTALNLQFSQNPAVMGSPMTISAQLTAVDNSDIMGGTLRLSRTVDEFGNPCSATYPTATWEHVATMTPGVGADILEYEYTPTTMGQHGWKAHYMPNPGAPYHQVHTTGMDLQVIEVSCDGDVDLKPTLTSVSTNGTTIDFALSFRVKACVDVVNLKLQGGLTAGVTNVSVSSGGTISAKNKNYVCTWQLGSLAQGQSVVKTVYFSKKFSAPGEHNVAGSWSAKGTRVSDGLATGNNYSGVMNYTVE